MSRSLRIAIVKTRECKDQTLKPALTAIEGVRVVAELDATADIDAMLGQVRPDVLFVSLGKNGAGETLDRLHEALKSQREISFILAGPERDPDLLLAALRCGVREFVELPTRAESLLKILQEILESRPERRTGKLLAFQRCGGGSGASTLAANIAVEIARSGRGSVALVDLDLHRGQLAAMLDLFPTYTLLDLCTLEMDDIDPARLDSALLKHDCGVRVLARPKNLSPDDLPLLDRTLSVITSLLEAFDYVVADLDIAREDTGGRIVNLVDELVLVGQPVISSIRNASELVKRLSETSSRDQKIRFVLNRVPKRPGSLKADNVEKSLKHPVFWEIPEDHEVISESINLGQPLAEHAAGSRVRGAIRDLAMGLIRTDAAERADRKTGLLKRIFKANVA